MTRPIQLENEEIYHVFNRGVAKCDIFLDDIDRLRFLMALYFANDAQGSRLDLSKSAQHAQHVVLRGVLPKEDTRDKLVEILAWCLMPNHFHLLVRQLMDRGISIFLQRLQNSHAKYFNVLYERSGSLFCRPFRAVHIRDEVQLTHTSRYLHINPLEFFDPMWKERGYVEDKVGAEKFLKGYKWSSLPDYLGHETDFTPIVDKGQIMEYFENSAEDYWKFINEWIQSDQLGVLIKEQYGE